MVTPILNTYQLTISKQTMEFGIDSNGLHTKTIIIIIFSLLDNKLLFLCFVALVTTKCLQFRYGHNKNRYNWQIIE